MERSFDGDSRVFQIAVRGWGNHKFYWIGGIFFTRWREPEEEWFWRFEPFSKLKTAFSEYWTWFLWILHDFSVTIPRCYKDVYVNSLFPHIARLWNSLLIECFPLIYDLSGFKSRISRHLFNCRPFLNRFPVCCSFCASFSCNSIPHSGCLVLHGVNLN